MPTNTTVMPRVSVIIPTYNAGSAFAELLRKLNEQTFKPFELIIIDSSSIDDTVKIAQSAGAMTVVIPQEKFDHGGTRNRAAQMASGDILLFMTQDAVPADEHMIKHLINPLIEGQYGYVYGRQLPYPSASLLESLTRSHNYPAQSMHKNRADLAKLGIKTFFCSNVCSAIPRAFFFELGMFKEPTIFNEDLFLAAECILAGYTVSYIAESRVYHSHDYTLIQQFRRFFDNGVSMNSNPKVEQYASVNGVGTHMLSDVAKQLCHARQTKLLPRLVFETALKYLGFQLGRRYKLLPRFLCARLSMHRKIWGKLRSRTE